MTRISMIVAIWLWFICSALPLHASTTTCSWSFATGSGIHNLTYCVTVNGNILQIQNLGTNLLRMNGEGYGVCDQNAPMNYSDYAVSDTGNWDSPILLSRSSSSVKIARATADGRWKLTQTITKVPNTSSITVVMALTNNQSVSDVAYLVRFADAEELPGFWVTGFNSVLASYNNGYFGLQLANVNVPPFSFWQGYVQSVSTGPNACAFAFNSPGGYWNGSSGSIEMAYVGSIAAGQTKSVTLSYRFQ